MKFAIGDLVRIKKSYGIPDARGMKGRVIDCSAGGATLRILVSPNPWKNWKSKSGRPYDPFIGYEYLDFVENGLDKMLELI